MAATIRAKGDIESLLKEGSLSRGGTAQVVFRTWDDASPPFMVKVRAPDGKTIVDRVIRELPTGQFQSVPPLQFLVASTGTYSLRISELYGKMEGEAELVVT